MPEALYPLALKLERGQRVAAIVEEKNHARA